MNTKLGGQVPECAALCAQDGDVLAQIEAKLAEYIHCMENVRLRDALEALLALSRIGNQFIQANQPWALLNMHDDHSRYTLLSRPPPSPGPQRLLFFREHLCAPPTYVYSLEI